MKRVLITGITGYIGSQLAQALSADCIVYGLVRLPINDKYFTSKLQEKLIFLPFDGSGESVLAALKISMPDVVFHLAAYYTTTHEINTITKLLNSNLMLGTYLLEAMAAVECRCLVYTTTVTTHCNSVNYKPKTLYAATKQAFSTLVEYYTSIGAIDAAALALSDTYGPNDCRPKVLNLIRKAALEQTPMDLTSGRQIFDVVYIDDVIRGLLCSSAALEDTDNPHQFFQLSGVSPRSLQDTVELMLQINDASFRANWGGRPEPENIVEQPLSLFPAPPNWKPHVSLEEGLRWFWNGILPEQGGEQLG